MVSLGGGWSLSEEISEVNLKKGIVCGSVGDGRGGQGLELEFIVRTTLTIDSIYLLYRRDLEPGYRRRKLTLTPSLTYITQIPYAETIQYYFELKPERGEIFGVASATDPRVLDAHRLDGGACRNRRWRVVLLVLLGILTGGAAAKGK